MNNILSGMFMLFLIHTLSSMTVRSRPVHHILSHCRSNLPKLRGFVRQVRPLWQLRGRWQTRWFSRDLGPGHEGTNPVVGGACKGYHKRRVRGRRFMLGVVSLTFDLAICLAGRGTRAMC